MNKSYSRNKAAYFASIFLGLLMLVSIFREKTFNVIYDGFFLICSIMTLVIGFWGLMTPIATIKRNKIELKLSLFISKTIDLEQIREIGYDKIKQVLKFDSLEFKLKWMNSDCRKDFINDLKMVREQIKND